jgi:hypothetical protein
MQISPDQRGQRHVEQNASSTSEMKSKNIKHTNHIYIYICIWNIVFYASCTCRDKLVGGTTGGLSGKSNRNASTGGAPAGVAKTEAPFAVAAIDGEEGEERMEANHEVPSLLASSRNKVEVVVMEVAASGTDGGGGDGESRPSPKKLNKPDLEAEEGGLGVAAGAAEASGVDEVVVCDKTQPTTRGRHK